MEGLLPGVIMFTYKKSCRCPVLLGNKYMKKEVHIMYVSFQMSETHVETFGRWGIVVGLILCLVIDG